MSFKDEFTLLAELDAAVHPNGLPEKTKASDLRAFLASLIAEILGRTSSATPAAPAFAAITGNPLDNSALLGEFNSIQANVGQISTAMTSLQAGVASNQLTTLNFKTGDTIKRIPFFAKVVLDTFKTCSGGGSTAYSFTLTLCTGTIIKSATTSIGAINLAIEGLTAAQASAGYDVAVNYTGTAAYATAQLKTFLL